MKDKSARHLGMNMHFCECFNIKHKVVACRHFRNLMFVGAIFFLSACGSDGDAGANIGNSPQNTLTKISAADDVLIHILACAVGVSVKIRAQNMTQEQLQQSCDKLLTQTSKFHALLQTDPNTPVSNDHNGTLEVVIFDDWDNYDKYGKEFFDIDTDNGGIYIEGSPSNAANQARFYAHEADWLRPDFVIWNLEHEYTHYLDGRYIKYGGFGFYPSKIVWWAEGLAEYIAQKNNSSRANSVLTATDENSWPTLNAIFNVTYNGSLDMIYGWTYWVHRFMFEQHAAEMILLSGYLKTGAEFSSYAATLDQWVIDYPVAFRSWLTIKRDELNSIP